MDSPERIGRYVISDRLGSGGFATVMRGHDEILDGPVAVKILAAHWLERMDIRRRFIDEARLLRRADSEHLVRVYDIGELDDGRPYFVMSYADRGTLEQQLTADTPVPVDRSLDLLEQLAKGVGALHRAGVLHRDLKPSNILITSDTDRGSRLLVADLGLAKETAKASGLTVSAGTPGYMAPEQITGEPLSRATDVYALGAIAYRLLTGKVPAVAVSGRQRQVNPARLVPEVPVWLDELVARMLSGDPEDRPTDANEVGRLLAAEGNEPAAVAAPVGAQAGAGGGVGTSVHDVPTTIAPTEAAHPTDVTTQFPQVVREPQPAAPVAAPAAPEKRRHPGRWVAGVLALVVVAAGVVVGGDALGKWHQPTFVDNLVHPMDGFTGPGVGATIYVPGSWRVQDGSISPWNPDKAFGWAAHSGNAILLTGSGRIASLYAAQQASPVQLPPTPAKISFGNTCTVLPTLSRTTNGVDVRVFSCANGAYWWNDAVINGAGTERIYVQVQAQPDDALRIIGRITTP